MFLHILLHSRHNMTQRPQCLSGSMLNPLSPGTLHAACHFSCKKTRINSVWVLSPIWEPNASSSWWIFFVRVPRSSEYRCRHFDYIPDIVQKTNREIAGWWSPTSCGVVKLVSRIASQWSKLEISWVFQNGEGTLDRSHAGQKPQWSSKLDVASAHIWILVVLNLWT